MAGSTFGTYFKITTWGESHGAGIGVVIDGCPAGLPLAESDIQKDLDLRRPGQSRFTTQRAEGDQVEILSGIFEGLTTGTPISLLVRNQDHRSADYSEISSYYRPGHADFGYDAKYGFRDYRGGGRSSGRETIGRVAAGAVARKLLVSLGIRVLAYTVSIGPVSIDFSRFEEAQIEQNPLRMPDSAAAEAAQEFLREQMAKCDSAGGIIECRIDGVPAGLGAPAFEKLDANLAKALMSVGAVKGVEIGDGFAAAASSGSINNDPFRLTDGKISKETNHSGGILGGISDGSRILLRAAVKPTPSISSPQKTVSKNGEPVEIQIKGRHDPVIVPRAVPVIEAMAALVLTDALFENMTSRLDGIRKFYGFNTVQ